MSGIECQWEQDVLDAVSTRRWPHRCEEALRSHVAACSICADVIEVSRALLDDQETAWQQARVPTSDIVWWRAQMRARAEAARTASRPMSIVHAVALASAAAGTIALFQVMRPWLWTWTSNLPALTVPPLIDPAKTMLSNVTLLPWSALLAMALWLLLAPVAVYLAVRDD